VKTAGPGPLAHLIEGGGEGQLQASQKTAGNFPGQLQNLLTVETADTIGWGRLRF
jgi:hypothetical protein